MLERQINNYYETSSATVPIDNKVAPHFETALHTNSHPQDTKEECRVGTALSAERERDKHSSTTGLSGLLLFHARVHSIPDRQPTDVDEEPQQKRSTVGYFDIIISLCSNRLIKDRLRAAAAAAEDLIRKKRL